MVAILREEMWNLLPETTEVSANVAYAPELDASCTMDVYRPRNARGAGVLFINSGGFRSGIFSQHSIDDDDRAHFLPWNEISVQGMAAPVPILEQFSFAPLLAAGICTFDARHPSGPDASLERIVRAIRLAVEFVQDHAKDFGIDPSRVGLWGCSSGGYLALLEALSSPNPRASRTVVAYYPGGYDFPAEAERFPEVIEGLPLENGTQTLSELSLGSHVRGSRVQALAIYGESDHPTINTTCESLARDVETGALSGRVKRLPGIGHQFMAKDGYSEEAGRRALTALSEWFEEHL